MAGKRRFGRVRKLPSGRYQARYPAPDGTDRPGPHTFARRADADRWLAKTAAEIVSGDWRDPDAGSVRLDQYATAWIAERPGLRPKTMQLYRGLLARHIGPMLGPLSLVELTPARVRSWRAGLLDGGLGPVTVAKAYRLLRAVMGTAVEDRLIRHNPCQIKGASVERSPERPVLTVEEVYALAAKVPPRYRLLVLLATFASMRWGELAALTREHVDSDAGVIHIRVSAVELANGSLVIGPPKSAAGKRSVAVPASLLPELREHMTSFVGRSPRALVFAGPKGGPLRRSNFQRHWRTALDAAGLASVHFHDLRHTGNTLTAHAGATLSDLMTRMGHASTRAARVYLHTTSERDHAVADALDAFLRSRASGT